MIIGLCIAVPAAINDLFYLIQISTQENDYESFGAEAFYVSKISFQPGAE
jgi:hypothetical protein